MILTVLAVDCSIAVGSLRIFSHHLLGEKVVVGVAFLGQGEAREIAVCLIDGGGYWVQPHFFLLSDVAHRCARPWPFLLVLGLSQQIMCLKRVRFELRLLDASTLLLD